MHVCVHVSVIVHVWGCCCLCCIIIHNGWRAGSFHICKSSMFRNELAWTKNHKEGLWPQDTPPFSDRGPLAWARISAFAASLFAFFSILFLSVASFPPLTYFVLSKFILAALCSSFPCLFPHISPTDLLSLITPFFCLSFSLYWVFTKLLTSSKTDIYTQQIWNLYDQHT